MNTPRSSFPVTLNSDHTVSVLMNKVEIGQGIGTAIAQIVAEELDVKIESVTICPADTEADLDGASTTGSNSIQGLGRAVRQAAADIRGHLIDKISAEWSVSPDALTVQDGVVRSGDGRETDLWALWLTTNREAVEPGSGQPKSPEYYQIVGQSVPRSDLPAKVTVGGSYIQDMCVAGMLHGRVVRPPSYGATLLGLEWDSENAELDVVRDGSFLGVVCEDEEAALQAAITLREQSRWSEGARLPEQDRLYDYLLAQPNQALLVVDGKPTDDPIPEVTEPDTASKTITATYKRPYQMHGALSPSAAMAVWTDGVLTVWSHSQGVFALRDALALVLDVTESKVRVLHAEGSGCYGHNGADDVSLDAALLARAVPDRHVMVKWSREDEHGWEPYGSCSVLKMQGSVNEDGEVVDWNHDVWSYTHGSRPRSGGDTSSLLAAQYLAKPVPPPVPSPGRGAHSGIHRNADPLYDFPHKRIVKHFVSDSPLRVSALRGLGAFANVFAIESFMDELAYEAGVDPVSFRLAHLDDSRAQDVIRAAASGAGWGDPVGDSRGLGMGFAQYKNEKAYVAVAADVSVDLESGVIVLNKMTIAGDVGQVINPDGVRSQLEGGMIQAASWALKEEVTFDRDRITSLDWETYPVLGFDEIPEVETLLMDRPGLPSLGCGEATQGPTPAAIANAVFAAVGLRLRQIPFRPDRVRAAAEANRDI